MEVEGVLGVKRLEAGSIRLREDGVWGNASEFLAPDTVFEDGVLGKGTANSRAATLRFAGDFVGDREGDVGGTSANDEIPFGDADASSRVRAEAFEIDADAKRAGNSAFGMLGIGVVSP